MLFTMLRIFQAMKRPNDQTMLPQSESSSSVDELVHRGYSRALRATCQHRDCESQVDVLVVHILIPSFAKMRGMSTFVLSASIVIAYPVLMNDNMTNAALTEL